MIRKLIVTLAIVAAATIGVRAGDKEGPGGPPRGGHDRPHGPHSEGLLPPPLLERLNLTDDQKAKVKELSDQFAKEAKEIREKAGITPEDFKAARDDEAKRKELQEKMKPVMEQLKQLRHDYMDKVKGILTDEQKAKLDEAIQHFKERGGDRHGGKHGPPPGGGGDQPPPPPPQ